MAVRLKQSRRCAAALRIEPDNPGAVANLGRTLIEMGDPDLLEEAESLCRRAVDLAPRLPQAVNNLGNVLRLRGKFDEALECFWIALQLDPRRVAPRYNMGQLLQERARYDEAARAYEEAESLEPNPARFHANLASLAAVREDYDQAGRHFRLALEADPGSAEAHHGLGLALLEQGFTDAAEVSLRESLRIKPNEASVWTALAGLQAHRGDIDMSCRSARTALDLRPKFAEAFIVLANNLLGRLPDAEFQAMRRLIDQKDLRERVRAGLHFSLAAVLHARARYAEAAAHLESANLFQTSDAEARGQTYDASQHSRFIDRLIATFPLDRQLNGREWGEPDPRPVFIVGLPRSGTTLVEQILASHPDVHGAGELPDVRLIFQSLPQIVGRPWVDPCSALHALDPAAARTAARRYVDRLESMMPGPAARVVDKMPDNIHFLGLIALFWPTARVIICSRDLRDVAISCWQTGFATIRWANHADCIARRFADYQRLLWHWRCTRPLEWLDLSYEDVVHDVEGQARRLIGFLGLDWNPACLAFHTNRRVVRTASLHEVRQPIHAHSVGRWRNYEALVPCLFQALERHGVGVTKPDFSGIGAFESSISGAR